MTSTKYIGMDVHKESISIAVRNAAGKIVMECVIETKARVILDFFEGLHGELHVTFEESTVAAWLYDLLKPRVARVVACNPRRNALLKVGNKDDRIDARKLSALLYGGQLQAVYHGEHGLRTLKELVRSYLTVSKDLARVDPRESVVPQLGRCMQRDASLLAAISCELDQQDQRTGGSPSGCFLFPATRCTAGVAPGSTAGAVGGEQEACGLETAL